jgi:tetratricopeptide (TPR) repeat protein
MRTVRALVSTNVGGIDAATVELTRVIDAIRDRPLALGCVLRDRGWLNFRDGNPDQALDDLLRAYALLRRNASREEAMVAAGRLSMAQFSVRDYPQALALVDETVAFFREEKAQIRLATALDRRAAILKAAGRLDEALIAATEALRIHEGIGDRVGTGLSQMRMCGVQIERNALAQAKSWCDRAELTLSQTNGMDDNDYRTLAALRGRLFLALGKSREAVAQFDRAIAPGGAQPAMTSPSCTSCARARTRRWATTRPPSPTRASTCVACANRARSIAFAKWRSCACNSRTIRKSRR